jgi:hypothetical protein
MSIVCIWNVFACMLQYLYVYVCILIYMLVYVRICKYWWKVPCDLEKGSGRYTNLYTSQICISPESQTCPVWCATLSHPVKIQLGTTASFPGTCTAATLRAICVACATVRAPQALEAPCSTSSPGAWFSQWTTRRMPTEKWTINDFFPGQSVPVCPYWWFVHCCAFLGSFAVVLIVILSFTIQIHAYTCKYMQILTIKKFPITAATWCKYTCLYCQIHANTCKYMQYNLIYFDVFARIWCKYLQVSLSVFASIASICMYSRNTKVLVALILANRCNTCKY